MSVSIPYAPGSTPIFSLSRAPPATTCRRRSPNSAFPVYSPAIAGVCARRAGSRRSRPARRPRYGLLRRLIDLITESLDAERATLFLYGRDTDELFSRVLRGEGVAEIRIPSKIGIAGGVFASGVAEIVPDVYRDARFNPEIDQQTGYR